MRHQKSPVEQSSWNQLPLWAALVMLTVARGLFAWNSAVRTDRRWRGELLATARLAAKSLDAHQLQALTGTRADQDVAEYLDLKQQLAAIRNVTPNCRFVYLLGRTAEGRIFFYVDDVPVGGPEEALAGTWSDHSVLVYASQGQLPRAVDAWLEYDPQAGFRTSEIVRDIVIDGRTWCLATHPLRDATGQPLGGLLVMMDITAEKTAFDFEGLLDRMEGYEDLLRGMVQGYLESLQEHLDALRTHAEEGDADRTLGAAHTIKGIAANMSAERLRDLAARLEQAARAGDLSCVTEALPQLLEYYQRLQQAVPQQDWDSLEQEEEDAEPCEEDAPAEESEQDSVPDPARDVD